MFTRYSYMIDNVILLITGTLHGRPIHELLPKCHPLGTFDQLAAINLANTSIMLYNAVLVDTPLGNLLLHATASLTWWLVRFFLFLRNARSTVFLINPIGPYHGFSGELGWSKSLVILQPSSIASVVLWIRLDYKHSTAESLLHSRCCFCCIFVLQVVCYWWKQ